MGAVAIIGAVISAAGTVAQISAAKKREKAEQRRFAETVASDERRVALEKRRQDVLASRQKRAAAGQARRAQGRAENLIASSGGGGAIGQTGSTQPGVAGNITSQLNSNNSFVNTVTSLGNQITGQVAETQRIAGQPITAGNSLAAFGGAAKSIGGFVASNAGAITKALS